MLFNTDTQNEKTHSVKISKLKLLLRRFVNMALPRSVKELSKLDYLPRHCRSDKFRGFSFIGNSFPLPDRSVSIGKPYIIQSPVILSRCVESHVTTIIPASQSRLLNMSITGKMSMTTD